MSFARDDQRGGIVGILIAILVALITIATLGGFAWMLLAGGPMEESRLAPMPTLSEESIPAKPTPVPPPVEVKVAPVDSPDEAGSTTGGGVTVP